MIAACSGDTKPAPAPGDAPQAVAAPVVDVPPLPKPPRMPFNPRKLSCAALLPAARAQALLGFTPDLVERANRRDGETTIVCTNRSIWAARALSILVSCGKKEAPRADFERLRALHENLAGAVVLPGKSGISAPTSHLALHPYRPCFVQVASRAPVLRPGGVGRLAAEIAAALP